jgi:hypothetical protein
MAVPCGVHLQEMPGLYIDDDHHQSIDNLDYAHHHYNFFTPGADAT